MTPADTMRAAVEALEYMLTEKADYMIRNHLGNPANEHSTKLGNSALSLLRSAIDGDLDCGMSWDGNRISGDSKSINAIKQAIHAAGVVDQLKDRIAELERRASIPPITPVEAGKVGVAAGVDLPDGGQR